MRRNTVTRQLTERRNTGFTQATRVHHHHRYHHHLFFKLYLTTLCLFAPCIHSYLLTC